ncbi:MAG: amidase family protein [Paracholeplasma sp.]|nr:amidase family protein [Paracholeplasma sp.]MDY3195746.1 amidase family protein [Paracholeplasma sp.]
MTLKLETLSIDEIVVLLDQQQLTSEDLVNYYLNQIKQYDKKYNSVAIINENAINDAQTLDLERKKGHKRSSLHGIPILIKDNIVTATMPTTANSMALHDLVGHTDAPLVQQLKEKGVIILGKTNLSEFAYFMSYDQMPSGYGSLHGQVVHPYDPRIDPLGSSTGSAVSVAANLIHLSIGTETNGSLMAPAKQCGIVAIKPSIGLVDGDLIIPISKRQDVAGPMGKTLSDCVYLLSLMSRNQVDYSSFLNKRTKHLSIGFINYENSPYDDEELEILKKAKEIYLSEGYQIKELSFILEDLENHLTLEYEFKNDLNHFLADKRISSSMKSLNQIIEFNLEDKKNRMKYGQSILTSSQQKGSLMDYNYKALIEKQEKQLSKYQNLLDDVDLIISTRRTSYAPMLGLPSISIPAKPMLDLTPRSLIFVSRRFDEDKLIEISYLYEQKTNYRYQHIKKR